MDCPNCGVHVGEGDTYCENCGAALDARNNFDNGSYSGGSYNNGESYSGGGYNNGGSYSGDSYNNGGSYSGNGYNNGGSYNGDSYNNGEYSNLNYNNSNYTMGNQKSNNNSGIIIAVAAAVAIIAAAVLIVTAVTGTKGTSSKKNNHKNEAAILTPTMAPTPVSTPEPTPIPAPMFTYVTSSSVRISDDLGGQYSADAVLNENRNTKWSPRKNNNSGIGEWIMIYADQPQYVTGVEILNGYQGNSDKYYNNSRVRGCVLSFSDGTSGYYTLSDTMDKQYIPLSAPVQTSYIKLVIDSVYSGSKWRDDTAVTYLGAY